MMDVLENDIPEIKSTISSLIQINSITSIRMNELTLIKKIGEGGQAIVYEGYYSGLHCAVKILSNIDWKCLMNEIVILANFIHPSIPKFYGIVNEEKTVALVFEFISGRNLSEIKPSDISFDNKLKIIKSVGSVLECMHAYYFIHRDLKPANIIINDNYDTFFFDFGIAKICTNAKNAFALAKGTINYLAPECLEAKDVSENEEIVSEITPMVDVWAFGCLVSYLFSGVNPWSNICKDDIEIRTALMEKKEFPIPEEILRNDMLKKIVVSCTKVNYKERADIKEINNILFI